MAFKIKRAYEPPEASDGYRVLVDRLWPRGLTKQKLHVDNWMKDIAPSTDLRKWIHGDMSRWAEFRRRYFRELGARPDLLAELRKRARAGTVTLVFGARDPEQNHAAVLREYLEQL
jgi:uncharacterized protein YeaO (DUF488 family)